MNHLMFLSIIYNNIRLTLLSFYHSGLTLLIREKILIRQSKTSNPNQKRIKNKHIMIKQRYDNKI